MAELPIIASHAQKSSQLSLTLWAGKVQDRLHLCFNRLDGTMSHNVTQEHDFCSGELTFPQVHQDSLSLSISSGENLLPCVYRGSPYMHGDEWKVDDCTTCACDNATLTCVIESCQAAFCPDPIKPLGECCFLCPYNVRVKEVKPAVTSSGTLFEGGSNSLQLNVPIKFQEGRDTTSAQGEDLWRLDAWASDNPDGTGKRTAFQTQVLTQDQRDQDYKKKDKFAFSDVDFVIDDPMAECSDLQYICTRIERGERPRTKGDLPFTLSGVPDQTAQTGCTRAPECKGIIATDFEWTMEPTETVIPGQATGVSLDGTVTFRENNPELSGSGLWRMGMYGSRNADGTGERFGYVPQTLNTGEAGTTLQDSSPLGLMNVETDFEIGSVGCNDFGYLCLEFTGGDNPTPNYAFRVDGAVDRSKEANTLTRCREQECLSNVYARSLDWDLQPTDTPMSGQVTGVSLDSTVTFKEGNREVAGNGLWRMGLFGSRSPNGEGERFGYVQQTLDNMEASTTLDKDSDLPMNGVGTQFELGTIGCNDFGYVCVEFTGGDDPDPLYYFKVEGAVDDSREANTIVECKEQECSSRAVFNDLEVDLGNQNLFENMMTPLTVDLTGITGEDSTNVMGDNLWKIGAYASPNPDGSGPKTGLVEQILDPADASTELTEGSNLPFEQVGFDFDMRGIRCEEAPYLCFDLDKNPEASVAFDFEAQPDDSVTTKCVDMRERCKGATAIDMDWEPEVGDAPFDQPSPLTIDAEINFEPDGADIEGENLWQMGLFASKNPDGSGPRKDEQTQVLDEFNQATPLEGPGPLQLDGIKTNFPINQLGCEDYGYLCMEFKRGQRPQPEFKFETTSGEDSIISCKKQECRGKLGKTWAVVNTFLRNRAVRKLLWKIISKQHGLMPSSSKSDLLFAALGILGRIGEKHDTLYIMD
ncbi:uncharacterized protein [Diadema setosum]|uniref:uncharacterized protein n=1 Tax=Diadema setosum TaxID=31175 RepID=UPI003B3AE75D